MRSTHENTSLEWGLSNLIQELIRVSLAADVARGLVHL